MNTTHIDFKVLKTLDDKSIYIQDCSMYNPDVVVSCNRLEVIPPEFATKYTFEYPLNSLISINSNAFGWSQTNDYDCLSNLQDGLWQFELSVSPNDLVFKKINWLKTSAFRNEILKYLNSAISCSVGEIKKEIETKTYNDILLILMEVEVAEYLACIDVKKSKLLFNSLKSKFKGLCDGM